MSQLEKWTPKSILPKHRAIMRYQLQGLSNIEIAERLQMTPQAISYIVNSDLYKASLSELQDRADDVVVESQVDARKKVTELSGFAAQELERMLRGTSISHRLRAEMCWDILDREGVREPEKKPDDANTDYAEALMAAYTERKAEGKNPTANLEIETSVSASPARNLLETVAA